MKLFIKGHKVKPGLTITNEWNTYVVNNDYQIRYVSSGNHAEVHMSVRELNSLLLEQAIKNCAVNVAKKIERFNVRFAKAMSKRPRRKE